MNDKTKAWNLYCSDRPLTRSELVFMGRWFVNGHFDLGDRQLLDIGHVIVTHPGGTKDANYALRHGWDPRETLLSKFLEELGWKHYKEGLSHKRAMLRDIHQIRLARGLA